VLEWKAKRTLARSKPCVIRVAPKKVFAPHQIRLMTLATFERIHAAVRAYALRTTFYMEGEPTANPHVIAMIELASKSNAYTSFSTNFTLMRKEWLEPLFA
jgi:hypothetical protein